MGISHDAGYAPFLDEILRDETTRRRVSVLEGVPPVRELVATGVHIFKIEEHLFRSDKLIDRTVNNGTHLSSSTTTTAATTTTNGAKATSPHTASATPFQPTPTPPLSAHASSPFSSYSTMAQKAAAKPASPPPQITIPLAPHSASAGTRKQPAAQQPKWNPGPRGLDKPIAVNQAVLEVVRKRKDNNKLCNNHFLRGPCAKGDSCTFVHHYRPTQDELDAIAWLSRLNPCTSGQDCEADDCIYGHHVSLRSRMRGVGG